MRKLQHIIILGFLIAILSGCSPVSVSELYSLPQLPDIYIGLQSLIDSEISSGSEYSSPTRGSNRQAVQLYDLDSDGDSEAVAFFRTGDGSLKICIYKSDDTTYSPACTISGEGSSIGRVEYADMNGDGFAELIVTWQIDGGINMLNVYSLFDWDETVLLTADCSGFTTADMDSNSKIELLLLHYDTDSQGYIDMYSLDSNHEMLLSSAQLSRGFDTVTRLSTGAIAGGGLALFAEGTYMESRTITDVLISDNGTLRNISAAQTGISHTTRSSAVYAEDIDGDGIIEVPITRKLAKQADESAEYLAFDWFKISQDGKLTASLSTFHCYSDGWYLELDDLSGYSISIRREDNVTGKCIIVSNISGDETIDLLAIYTFTGENRYERAHSANRVFIDANDTTVYAMRILSGELDADAIAQSFHLIRSEWISPVM